VKEAIERVDSSAKSMGIDAIIVTRGGGGLEELWSFNNRGVVEAAFRCQTPIVAAIGHESDTSIIELVADHRASTPTQAAMVLVPDRDELLQMIEHSNVRLLNVTSRNLERCCSSLVHVEQKVLSSMNSFIHRLSLHIASRAELLVSKRPHALVQSRQKKVMIMQASLRAATTKNLTNTAHRIGSLESRLESIGPIEVLRRGFSLTQDSSGNIVRSSKNVQEGDQIRTVLADGSIKSKVECAS
jgi:exodeoxyribonuclease VII large subunit